MTVTYVHVRSVHGTYISRSISHPHTAFANANSSASMIYSGTGLQQKLSEDTPAARPDAQLWRSTGDQRLARGSGRATRSTGLVGNERGARGRAL